jgi:hypothetical protein
LTASASNGFSAVLSLLRPANVPEPTFHHQQQEPQQNDNTSYALMVEQLQEKDKQISELHILLQNTINQNTITDKDDEHKKAWWKFWA